MKNLVFILLFLLPYLYLPAQVNLDTLARMCEVFKGTNSDSLDIYAREGLRIAEEQDNGDMLATFYRYAGISCFQKQDYETSSIYLEKALDLAVKHENRLEIAATYLARGYMHSTQSDMKLQIEYMLKALPVFEELDEIEKVVETLVGVGSSYRRTGNREMAIKYLNQAKDKLGGSKDAFLNGLTYFELGAVEPDINKSIEYELKTVEYARVANNKILENLGNQALALFYSSDQVKDYKKALIHAAECYRIAKELGSQSYIYSALTMLSNIHRRLANYKECELVSLQAWAMDSTNLLEARNLARNIAIANIHLKNEEKAAEFFNKYEELNNEYTKESYHKQLIEMEAKYETEKKEMRIVVLEEEQKLHIGLGITIGVVLLLGLCFLYYYQRSKRKIAEQQISRLEQEKELVATRSALDAEKAEREIIARDLHDGIGAMLSVVKNNMSMMKSYSIIENREVDYFSKALEGLDKSITELRRVAHHIMPALLIKKGLAAALEDFCRSVPEIAFHFTEPGKRLDTEKELVLYRCAYELINNALRHSRASQIDVYLNMDEKTVYLSVVDNGCGFDQQVASEGMGINNMRIRLSVFGGRMDIYSEPGKGTEVNIELGINGK